MLKLYFFTISESSSEIHERIFFLHDNLTLMTSQHFWVDFGIVRLSWKTTVIFGLYCGAFVTSALGSLFTTLYTLAHSGAYIPPQMITWQHSPVSPRHFLVSLYIFLASTIHLSQIPTTRSSPCFKFPLILSFALIPSLPSLVHIASANSALTFNPPLQFLSLFHNSSHVVLLTRPAALDHLKTTSPVNPVF